MSNIYSTLPSVETFVAVTSAIPARTGVSIEGGVIGIHDPYASFNPSTRNDIGEIGSKWVRTALNWNDVQPSLGNYSYDWSNYDAVFADYKSKNIKPLVNINGLQITADSDWTVIDADFQRFFKAAVDRYKDVGVHHWEIFNEPNLPGYGWPGNSPWREGEPVDYFGAWVLLLSRATTILHESDPLGVSVNGGFSPDGFDPFGAGLYSTYKAQNAFDVFAFHPYNLENNQAAGVDAIMNQFRIGGDDPNTPIWFNEWGTQDNAMRDASIARSLEQFSTNYGKVDGYFMLGLRDGLAGQWGLKTADRTPKAAWTTVRGFLLKHESQGVYPPALQDHLDPSSRTVSVSIATLSSNPTTAGATLSGTSSNNTLTGTAGNDTIKGNAGNDRISGKLGNDAVYGGTGNDVMTGDAHDDRLYGESGKDVLYGGGGDDLMVGGADADIFRFRGDDWGTDKVVDFQDGLDLLDLRSNGLTFGKLSIAQKDADGDGRADDVIIKGGADQTIHLLNLKASLLDASDFLIWTDRESIMAEGGPEAGFSFRAAIAAAPPPRLPAVLGSLPLIDDLHRPDLLDGLCYRSALRSARLPDADWERSLQLLVPSCPCFCPP